MKDVEEKRIMDSNNTKIKFTPYSDANDVIDKPFKSLCSTCQENLETSIKGSDFIFDSVQLFYCQCHKVNFSRGGSYIDSPGWIKKKKPKINSKNTLNVFNRQQLLH